MHPCTLFSLTLVLLVPFRCAAGSMADNETQKRAIAEIEKSGGKVQRDETRPEKPIVIVSLFRKKADDATMAHVKAFPQLEWLGLESTSVTDTGFANVKDLKELKEVIVSDTNITGAALANLKGMTKLERLDVHDTAVTDDGLEHLKDLRALRDLQIYRTGVTDAGLAHIKKHTNLRKLGVLYQPITDAGLAHLKGLTELEDLNLLDTKVTDAGLVHLENMAKLQALNIFGTLVTEKGVDALRKKLPNLKNVAYDPPDPDAKLLLDAAIKAMGDEAKIAKLQTGAAKGTITGEENGQDTSLSFDASWRGINQYRIAGNFSFRGMNREILIVINGEQAWGKFNDKVEEAPADAVPLVKNGLHALRIPLLLPSLRGDSYKLSLTEEVKVAERPAIGMTVVHKDYKDVSLFFEIQSGLPVKSEVTATNDDGKDMTIEYLYSDYKDFHGVKLPSKITIKADGKEFTMKLEQLKAEEKLEDSLFEKP